LDSFESVEKFEDTKKVIRSKKDRQDYGPKKDRQDYGPKKDSQDYGPKKDRQDYGPKIFFF
jgi:hypothetical protein